MQRAIIAIVSLVALGVIGYLVYARTGGCLKTYQKPVGQCEEVKGAKSFDGYMCPKDAYQCAIPGANPGVPLRYGCQKFTLECQP